MLRHRRLTLSALFAPLLAATWLLAAAPPAHAGCGCDHPPPAWSPVMPPFAPPGAPVLVNLDGNPLVLGQSYGVTFAPLQGSNTTVTAVALSPSALVVKVPSGTAVGPAQIKVMNGKRSVQTLSSSSFTVVSPLPVVPAEAGALSAARMDAAVTADGTLLIPVNVRHVQQAVQFAIRFPDLPLAFGPDDVVFYNVDGFDLTLFTLAVNGQTEMQWGSYYGWQVEEDSGLSGLVYDNKVKSSTHPSKVSDLLTYWRHEFVTYTQAHQPGASHEVRGGLHPDGTVHVNHGHLILAIRGMLRSTRYPNDPTKMSPLAPGRVAVTVEMLGVPAEAPIEPETVGNMLAAQSSFAAFGAPESHFDEFAGSGSTSSSDSGSSVLDSAAWLSESLATY